MGKHAYPPQETDWRERVAKWRTFFASWQLGTRSSSDGETKAVKHHRELSILMRVELNALADLLIKKGVFTEEEFGYALQREAKSLDSAYAESFPGFRSSDAGMDIDIATAWATMQKLGFPP